MNAAWHTCMHHGAHEWCMAYTNRSCKAYTNRHMWNITSQDQIDTWVSRSTHVCVMTHMNEVWHTRTNHGLYEWMHMKCNVLRSRQTREWVVAHMHASWSAWMRHGIYGWIYVTGNTSKSKRSKPTNPSVGITLCARYLPNCLVVCVHVSTCVCMYVCMRVCVYACACVRMRVCV